MAGEAAINIAFLDGIGSPGSAPEQARLAEKRHDRNKEARKDGEDIDDYADGFIIPVN